MIGLTPFHAQNKLIRDTIVMNDESISETVFYSARDSIYSDLKNKQIHLYGNASLTNGEIKISAGYILVDLKKNEVWANYRLSGNQKTERPSFDDGAEKIEANSIRYNFNTKRGYIEELSLKQDEAYLYMGTAKRQANEEIHFINGRFTTCDLQEPHYHFQLAKAIMIPEKRIVTGPMNLWIKGVPTPLGMPFSIIPQQKERTQGFLFPQLIPVSIYGFGFQDLGYYMPINKHMQTSIYSNLYSRGSWGIKNDLEYAKLYGFKGHFLIGFQQFKSGFPENKNANKLTINWTHKKDLKSNPYWNFSSNVNFISDNQSKNNLDPLNPQYFNNAFNSDVNINRMFPGKPITGGLKLSVKQSTQTKNIALTSPILNINVTRFFPFKDAFKKNGVLAKTLKQIGVVYNLEGQNRTSFKDSLLKPLNTPLIGRQFMYGISQSTIIQTTSSLFKNTLKLTPSISYSNKLNFQQTLKSFNAADNTTQIDTIQKTGMYHELSFNIQLTSVLYNYYKFIGHKKPLLRHILTPSIGFRYIPQVNQLISSNAGINQSQITYSPFERSLYTGNTNKTAALLTFGINNTFELKRMSSKDTLTGFKKTRIIDLLSINGNYDFMKDSMNLSDFSLNMRINPVEWLNFVASSTFSPYGWNDTSGIKLKTFALNSNHSLGRFISTNFTTTVTLTSKTSRQKIQESQQQLTNAGWDSDYTYFALHPEYLLNFNIPWKLSFSHVYSINSNVNINTSNPDKYNQIQTLVANGDVSFTKRWKLATTMNFDFNEMKLTNARYTLSRNMHCWALSFYWTPIGGNKSFLLSIRNTSKLFQDAKIDIRKPPAFF
jgi:hypothetical protein